MLFNTWTFGLFFVIVYGLYRLLPRRPQNVLLLVASYVFYGYWDYRFLTLIWASTILDYICGRAIYATKGLRHRQLILTCSVVGNLSILGFFKYFNFFVGNLVQILEALGLGASMPVLSIILPVGISFYTFQTLSYTIDIYRGQLKPTKNFIDFATFVAFFPQLVAGPIERARNLLPQFTQDRSHSWEKLRTGAWLVVWGLFKKICVADRLAPIVNAAFADPGSYQGIDLIIAVNAFAFQIYGDFSGYSDIARGVAKLLGFELMVNFRHPYFAHSPSDLWRRWHISLSSWLQDYLYVPLGGNREGSGKTYRNVMMTMTLGGLWHGAAWNFLLWGAYHGAILCLARPIRTLVDYKRLRCPVRRAACWGVSVLVTYCLVLIGYVFFRAQDMGTIKSFAGIITGRFGMSGIGGEWLWSFVSICWFLWLMDVWQFATGSVDQVPKAHRFIRLNVWLFAICSIAFLSARQGQEFIYFAF